MRAFRAQSGAAWLPGTVLWLLMSGPAFGLVLHPGDEAPPPVRPPDAAVGRWVDNGSCVPVGPDYVITTRHQDWLLNRPVWIDGVEYRTAEIFDHQEADLRVVRIATPEGQDADLDYYMAPYTGNQERHETMVIGGYGKGRGVALTTPLGMVYGYAWSGTANDTLRWGANRVDGFNCVVEPGYVTEVLTADFDRRGSLGSCDHEAAPAAWDSGGPWCIDITGNGDWRVAGLTRSVEHGPPINESWFLNNVTGRPDPDYLDAVRVSSYAGWINGVIDPSAWSVDASGNWTDAANWSCGVPNAANTWAVLGDAITDDRTVMLDAAVTLGTLRIDDDNGYTIQGAGHLTFVVENHSAGIEVNRQKEPSFHGAHTVSVPITLAVPLVLNTWSDGDLTLAGIISGPQPIIKRGEGTAVLAAANTFSGGLTVEGGAIRATDPAALGSEVILDGGSLDLRNDTSATFADNVTAKADTSIRVRPEVSATGQTLWFGRFLIEGNRTLTVTGADDYCLGVSGMTTFDDVTGTVTVDTASADLLLPGGLALVSGAMAKTGPCAMAIGGAQLYGGGAVMRVDGGTVRFDSDAGPGGQVNLAVTVTDAGAAVQFGATQHVVGLEIGDGAAQILAGTGSVLVTNSLSIDETDSSLDMADGAMILNYTGTSPLPQVIDWLRSGLGEGVGYWDGGGITSSAAAAEDRALTAVGVLDNADAGLGGRESFLGEDVDATSILARYTWWGDADLNGVVDSNDYDRIDNAWLLWTREGVGPEGGFRWAVGDFNYDGTIDSNDYDLIDRAWLLQTGSLPTGAGSSGAAAPQVKTDVSAAPPATLRTVPDPATVGLLAVGTLILTVGRRCARRTSRRAGDGSTPRVAG